MFDWARLVGHDREQLPFASAVRFYNADHNGPIAFEPSGEDFLSPCLAEADLMRRVCTPPEFTEWLTAFLPDFPMLRPVASPDPSRRQTGALRWPESEPRLDALRHRQRIAR